MFSAMEHLTLEHEVYGRSSEEHNKIDCIEWCHWCKLGSFGNMKILRIDNGLVEELTRCLQLDDGRLLLSCYRGCRSSHILGVVIPVRHLLHSSMLVRTQVAHTGKKRGWE
jgi:hypothetical protein